MVSVAQMTGTGTGMTGKTGIFGVTGTGTGTGTGISKIPIMNTHHESWYLHFLTEPYQSKRSIEFSIFQITVLIVTNLTSNTLWRCETNVSLKLNDFRTHELIELNQ